MQWLSWSKSVYPSLANPEILSTLEVAGLDTMDPGLRRVMFLDDAGATLLEQSDGVWPAIERNTARRNSSSTRGPVVPHLFSAPELLQVYNEQIQPAQLQVGSRVNYSSGWR